MRKLRHICAHAPRLALLAAGLVAGFGVGAGVISTVAQSGDTTQLHACVANNTGVVRLVNASAQCYGNEHTVAWSVSGPDGAAGAPGAQGERGPSDVYVQEQVGVIDHGNGTPQETIVSFTPPVAGSYVLQSRVQVTQDVITVSPEVTCALMLNGVTVGAPITVSIPASLLESVNSVEVRNDAASALDAGDLVTLHCDVSGGVTYSGGYLQAQLVGNLHDGGNP